MDGPGGTLGKTIIPAAGPLSNVIIALDPSENWFCRETRQLQEDFSSTVMHEIGHAIGIDHSQNQEH